jgi:hypothetical protein
LHKKLFCFCLQKFGKTIGKVADFGLNSKKSLRKANSLLRYFRAFWVQSGIAAGYAGYFLPFLKKGKKCQPSSKELIGLIAAKV